MRRFNLLEEPWIPCTTLAGRQEQLGIREVLLRAHELRQIGGESPLEAAALFRLLLAVCHAALRGPGNLAERAALWECRSVAGWGGGKVLPYLEDWRDRFFL
ncbi:MAG: type I-E CRISPR-associated protein Cse1/CasA, partial [Armatimonadetes bacterium]|nr:type I-E CRISPR-associated protein Cse1/CasA [Armatimonadota bacterium]